MTIQKLDNNRIEETTTTKQEITKDELQGMKAVLEMKLAKVNSQLALFK